MVWADRKVGTSGEEEGGPGPRNDVVTTCRAVTLRGGQRIIALYFSQSKIFQKREASQRGNNTIIEKIISCLFVFLAYRLCPLALKLYEGIRKRDLKKIAI